MAINQPGIAIVIKGFLPTGKTLDEQLSALTIVKTAHETGDYSALLQAAHDVEIKTESKTRRVEVEEATAPVEQDNQPQDDEALSPDQIEIAKAGPVEDGGQADWLAQPDQPAEDTAPEQQTARARKKANGNE